MNKHVFFTLTVSFLLFSCGTGDQNEDQRIRIDGSGTVYPLTEAVAEEFRAAYPDIRVTVGTSGTGAGFTKFARGETDITNSSRPVRPEEQQALDNNNIAYKQVTVALDGIAVVVHPENDWIEDITVEELREIWVSGSEIELWSDIREGWPDQEIHLYGPNTAHGTYDFFTEAITGESGNSRGDYNAVADYNVAVQGISTDQYALGYFGLAYYEENSDRLKLLGVDNGDGPVEPTLETVKDGSYAPLSRSLYIYVADSAAEREAVQTFVNFYLDNAGVLAEEIGYVSLPGEEYTQQKEEFSAFIDDSEAATAE